MFIVPLRRGLQVPVCHREHQDWLNLDGLRVPGVGKYDPRVGMSREEHLEQLTEQLLPQKRDWGIYLQQAQHQNIRTGLSGKCKEFSNLKIEDAFILHHINQLVEIS